MPARQSDAARHGAGGVFRPAAAALAALLVLTACMGGPGGGVASKGTLRADQPAGTSAIAGQGNPAIAALQARRSVLPPGGPFARVAEAVLRADSGAAAAELRMARLRATAKDKNWLPRIGPSVTLSALNGLAAGLLLEQAILDHGRRKAERAYAATDVEVTAVSLALDINQRVYEGLVAHVQAERARAQAAISARAAARLAEFASIMAQRVEGGLSDRSEEQIITLKQSEMQATLAADRQAEAAATADLAAMADPSATAVRGIDALPLSGATAEPLSVAKARSEGARAVAEAQVARADLLPGLSGGVNVGSDSIDPTIKLGGAGLLGLGTGDEVAALAETGEVMARRTADADETARRRLVSLEGQIAILRSREAQGAAVLASTEANLSLFTEQYKVGRRTLLELVGQYDSFARLEREQAAIRYEVALTELEIARDRGLLVDGARM